MFVEHPAIEWYVAQKLLAPVKQLADALLHTAQVSDPVKRQRYHEPASQTQRRSRLTHKKDRLVMVPMLVGMVPVS